MKKNKKLLRKAVCSFVLAGGICLASFGAEPEAQKSYFGEVLTVYAEEKMSGYENPKDIIIAAPAAETYSTTASKVISFAPRMCGIRRLKPKYRSQQSER